MRTESERVTMQVGGQTMNGYLARPVPDDPRRFPAVIVFQEIFGVNAHIRSVVDRIAAEGYVALAPDIYHRTAPGMENPYDQESMQKGMALIGQLKRGELLADTDATIAYLASRADVNAGRLGAVGFCIGGHIAYLVATTGKLRATASFYGGGITQFGFGDPKPTVEHTEGIKGKILCFFGADDSMIPPADVEKIREQLYKHSIRNELFVYPDTGHAFFRDGNSAYRKMAADDAWKKVKKVFLEELHSA